MGNKEKNYSHDWIHKLEGPYHWQLYWNQLDLAINKSGIDKDNSIIEIGVGSGFTSNYLKRKGFSVTTIDIDSNKSPDIVADITNSDLPYADMYLAFEIFEHIPLENVIQIWKRLSEKGVSKIIFSIPHAYRTYFWFEFWSPLFGNRNFHIGRKRGHINSEHHFWEIGIDNVSTNLVTQWLEESGYSVPKTYRYRNHQFFIAELNESE